LIIVVKKNQIFQSVIEVGPTSHWNEDQKVDTSSSLISKFSLEVNKKLEQSIVLPKDLKDCISRVYSCMITWK